MTATNSHTSRKDHRLALRLTSQQDALIRQAAAVRGQSLNEFVMTATLESAEDALADRRVFQIGEDAWAEFNALLDRPARRIDELAALLNTPAPWDE